jgi:hypothetical protein
LVELKIEGMSDDALIPDVISALGDKYDALKGVS